MSEFEQFKLELLNEIEFLEASAKFHKNSEAGDLMEYSARRLRKLLNK